MCVCMFYVKKNENNIDRDYLNFVFYPVQININLWVIFVVVYSMTLGSVEGVNNQIYVFRSMTAAARSFGRRYDINAPGRRWPRMVGRKTNKSRHRP